MKYFNKMHFFLDTNWTSPWWTFPSEDAGLWNYLYSGFNCLEGIIWTLFAVVVMRRYLQHRKSRWEIVYALTFLSFGATDFAEAFAVSVPLLLVKGAILIALASLRKYVRRSYYPTDWF